MHHRLLVEQNTRHATREVRRQRPTTPPYVQALG